MVNIVTFKKKMTAIHHYQILKKDEISKKKIKINKHSSSLEIDTFDSRNLIYFLNLFKNLNMKTSLFRIRPLFLLVFLFIFY